MMWMRISERDEFAGRRILRLTFDRDDFDRSRGTPAADIRAGDGPATRRVAHEFQEWAVVKLVTATVVEADRSISAGPNIETAVVSVASIANSASGHSRTTHEVTGRQ
jgi:hypothetical protein